MSNKHYRVCNTNTQQGLWYDFKGEFTGLIHDDFNFCQNSKLKMDFDEKLIGWLSAVKELHQLWQWFSPEDIKKLQEYGWFIHEYECEEEKFYEKFQHIIIKQDKAKLLNIIKL